MSISESDRRDLYVALEPVLGPEAANNLMSMLPHQPANELVTRADMHAFGAELRGEMAELKADLRTSFQRYMTGAAAANLIAVVGVLVA